jgi:hypothetical protein
VSPSDVEHAHKGSNGKVLRVYKYTDGSVRKVNPNNWTEAAHAKFLEMYGGDGTNEGFEEAKKKRGKKHANDAALEQMDEMRAMLEKLTAERDAAQAALVAKSSSGEEKSEPVVDEDAKAKAEAAEAKAKADKKAKLKAEKAKKKAEKLAKKKAEAAEALKKQQEELKRQQEALQKQMAATDEMSEEEDSDAFDSDEDSDEEEVVFNGYEHNGTLYHLDEETQELSTEDGEYFGYIGSDGEVHEGEKSQDE